MGVALFPLVRWYISLYAGDPAHPSQELAPRIGAGHLDPWADTRRAVKIVIKLTDGPRANATVNMDLTPDYRATYA